MEFEIFRTGKHTANNGNTKTYTEQDLDKIAESYNPKESEAPIVVGHPKDNSPAYGWIESIKRVGDRLVAKAKDIVPEFTEALKKGLYKKRSISLTPDGKLRHVGFLGAALPAVKGLADIKFNEEDQTTYEMDFSESELKDDKTKAKVTQENNSNNSLDHSSFNDSLNQIQTMLKKLSDDFSTLDQHYDSSQVQNIKFTH